MQETMDPLEVSSPELFKTDDGLSISVTKHIPHEEYEKLWQIVNDGFKELNQKSYEKQDMTKEELEEDLNSEHVLKYVARDAEKGLVGLLTVHIGLDGITWADTSELDQLQKQTDPSASPYYVGTIVVPTSERGTSAATSLIRGALLHFGQVNEANGQDSLVFFDCAEANYPWLGQFIQEVGSPSEQFPHLKTEVRELYVDTWMDDQGNVAKVHGDIEGHSGTVLDRQHYYAISLDKS